MEYIFSTNDIAFENIETIVSKNGTKIIDFKTILENIEHAPNVEFTGEALNNLKNGDFVSAGLMVFGKIKTHSK
jgi:lantibiotic modifying enzyme